MWRALPVCGFEGTYSFCVWTKRSRDLPNAVSFWNFAIAVCAIHFSTPYSSTFRAEPPCFPPGSYLMYNRLPNHVSAWLRTVNPAQESKLKAMISHLPGRWFFRTRAHLEMHCWKSLNQSLQKLTHRSVNEDTLWKPPYYEICHGI